MGSKQMKFEEEHIREFEAATPFNRSEIIHAFERFREIYNMSDANSPTSLVNESGYINQEVSVPKKLVAERLTELKKNPFRYRIVDIFSRADGEMMNFVEFLDMVSAFSPKNPLKHKICYAFQLYDIDEDGIISKEDLFAVMDILMESPLEDHKKDQIVAQVFKEVNKENSDGLSVEDFHYAISRAPDFSSTFRFRI